MPLLDIVVVTFNSPNYAVPCVRSILREYDPALFHLYLVNNGDPEHQQYFSPHKGMTIIQMNDNAGWEGGLKAALPYCQSPYVMFMNDDTFIPDSSHGWIVKLLSHFIDPLCAAVGPSSNVVMGAQQIFQESSMAEIMVNFLIGLCMVVRRSDLNAAGGIDDSLPGGDDLDLSIRLRDLGKYLIADRNVFVFHHGFKTGERVHGGYWNSLEMTEKTNFALINKHGIRKFQNLWSGPPFDPDQEGKLIASLIKKEDKTIDLGCGTRRTVPWAVGYDIVPRGTFVPNVFPKGTCVADHLIDVTQPLPIDPESQDVIVARHILEHIADIPTTLQNWKKVLRHGGRLIIAVPNDQNGHTMAEDHDHKQAFTPDSFRATMEANGFKVKDLLDPKNQVSFVGVCEKNGLQ